MAEERRDDWLGYAAPKVGLSEGEHSVVGVVCAGVFGWGVAMVLMVVAGVQLLGSPLWVVVAGEFVGGLATMLAKRRERVLCAFGLGVFAAGTIGVGLVAVSLLR